MKNQKKFLAGLASVLGAVILVASTGVANGKGTPCGDEGQNCYQSESAKETYRMSYGTDSIRYNVVTDGMENVPCSNQGMGGDPSRGKPKNCKTTKVAIPSDVDWTDCAQGDAGQTCSAGLNDDGYALVRYGAGNSWLYAHVGGDFECRLYGLGLDMDPAPNIRKSCQVGQKITNKKTTWTECASKEGGKCEFPTNSTYLVRYGRTGQYWYKEVSGKSMTCELSSFRWDPSPNNRKACSYMPFVTSDTNFNGQAIGKWEKVNECKGSKCGSTEFEISSGLDDSGSETKSSEWTNSFEASLTQTVGYEGAVASGETSVTLTAGFSSTTAKELAKTFSVHKGTSLKTTCTGEHILYRWVMEVQEACGASGTTCTTTANSTIHRCLAVTDPAPLKPPA